MKKILLLLTTALIGVSQATADDQGVNKKYVYHGWFLDVAEQQGRSFSFSSRFCEHVTLLERAFRIYNICPSRIEVWENACQLKRNYTENRGSGFRKDEKCPVDQLAWPGDGSLRHIKEGEGIWEHVRRAFRIYHWSGFSQKCDINYKSKPDYVKSRTSYVRKDGESLVYELTLAGNESLQPIGDDGSIVAILRVNPRLCGMTIHGGARAKDGQEVVCHLLVVLENVVGIDNFRQLGIGVHAYRNLPFEELILPLGTVLSKGWDMDDGTIVYGVKVLPVHEKKVIGEPFQ